MIIFAADSKFCQLITNKRNIMLERLQQIDTSLLLALNGSDYMWIDLAMMMLTTRWLWVPLYILLLVVVYFTLRERDNMCELRYDFKWQFAGVVAMFVLGIVLSDQITSGLLKEWVGRMRPSNLDNPISSQVKVVMEYRGGPYGFPSSHASNSFCLATLCCLYFRNRWTSIAMLFWAVIHSYTRIYLGVHYPGDVIVGALIGTVVAVAVYFAFYRILHFEEYDFKNPICKLYEKYILYGVAASFISVAIALALSPFIMDFWMKYGW